MEISFDAVLRMSLNSHSVRMAKIKGNKITFVSAVVVNALNSIKVHKVAVMNSTVNA
jgi:hypothetical protein